MTRPFFAISVATALACGGSSAGDLQDATDVTSRNEIDAGDVPADLQPLISLAERWGIGDDVERADYIAQTTAADREALRTAVQPHQARITAWLDSFGTNPMSDEAAAFMYMQLAIEELPN
jgi:hypothetical protein